VESFRRVGALMIWFIFVFINEIDVAFAYPLRIYSRLCCDDLNLVDRIWVLFIRPHF